MIVSRVEYEEENIYLFNYIVARNLDFSLVIRGNRERERCVLWLWFNNFLFSSRGVCLISSERRQSVDRQLSRSGEEQKRFNLTFSSPVDGRRCVRLEMLRRKTSER